MLQQWHSIRIFTLKDEQRRAERVFLSGRHVSVCFCFLVDGTVAYCYCCYHIMGLKKWQFNTSQAFSVSHRQYRHMGVTYCLDRLPHVLGVRFTSYLNGHEKGKLRPRLSSCHFQYCSSGSCYCTLSKTNGDVDTHGQLYIRG